MLPTGIWYDRYSTEARILVTRRSRVWTVILLAALLVAPLVAGPWILGEVTNLFITLIAVYGLYVTVGMAGQINIAQSAFVGVGAFAWFMLGLKTGWSVRQEEDLPAGATETLSLYVYHQAFQVFRMGTAAAAGLFLIAVAVIASGISFATIGRHRF